MSQLKLQTKNDITAFFKILAEESVKMAHSDLQGLKDQQERDEKAYRTIKQEQDGPDDVEVEDLDFDTDDEDDEGIVVDDEVDISPVSGDEGVEVVTSSEDVSIEDVSLDSIEDKLNGIRAGRSLKDSQVEKGMRTYFDALSDPERLALYAFVDTLAAIMTLADEGTKDPSDPPYNVQMTTGDETVDSLEIEDEDVDTPVPSSPDVEGVSVEEEEDEGVPIQVGGVQDISEIRRRVKSLMEKK
tara:strand:- start:1965 stop:2693 length:729 start_codon:yes stop_codon:yes gene_type:complete